MDRVLKVLISQAAKGDKVVLSFAKNQMTLTCGGAKILIPTK